MSADNSQEKYPAGDSSAALTEWQRLMLEPGSPALTPAAPVAAGTTRENEEIAGNEEACALCYRPFPPEKLTVASKERFNWESSVVVCPECLTELKLELRARSSGADLLLGLVWAVLGFIVTAGIISLAIWSVRTDTNYNFWQWIGCYFAFVPAFIIGRLVRFGVGKRHSLEQQLIAIFFTLGVVVVTAYIGWIADNNNFADAIMRSNEHKIAWLPPDLFIKARFWPALTSFTTFENIIPRLGIDFGIILGVAVAYLSSEGVRIYTRSYKRR